MEISVAMPDERSRALNLLLAEFPPSLRQLRCQELLKKFTVEELSPEGLLVLRESGQIIGTLFLQRLPGNIAILGMPHAPTLEEQVALVRAAVELLRTWRVSYAQANLMPSEFRYQPALLAGGIKYLTQLEFYQLRLEQPTWESPTDIVFEPVNALNHANFLETLFQSYTDTLDSPELNGTRTSEEISQEYQAFAYSPPAWWLIRRQGLAVGVLILSPGSDDACELSYLGLVPEARGQGLGQQLLTFAQFQARKYSNLLILSVDERNTPARQLYLRAGFVLERIRRICWYPTGQSS